MAIISVTNHTRCENLLIFAYIVSKFINKHIVRDLYFLYEKRNFIETAFFLNYNKDVAQLRKNMNTKLETAILITFYFTNLLNVDLSVNESAMLEIL